MIAKWLPNEGFLVNEEDLVNEEEAAFFEQ
jgi:hypothetical protein